MLKNFLGIAAPSEVDPREVARWFYHSSCSSDKISGQKNRWVAAQPVLRLYGAVEQAERNYVRSNVRTPFCGRFSGTQ